MKRLGLILLLSSMAWGQGAFIPPQQALKVVNGITSPIPNATITVCAANASGIPCTPVLVSAIFKDAGLTQPLPNPFTADANGNYQFAIATGTYTITTTALGFAGTSFQITVASGSGGGGGSPGGANSSVQFNSSGTLGGVSIAPGQALVGSSGIPIAQVKPMFDVRDSVSNFDCTGNNAMDTGMQSIASTAHILVPAGCVVRLATAHSYPQTFEFAQGGQLKPNTGTLITLTGPIIAGSYQIFSNALATQGGIDFTGNVNTFDVLPEWWGAATTASAATNTTAIQAAIYGAFGCNVNPVTTCRTNASATSFYNKRLFLAGKYSIAGELHWYHTLNFIVQGMGRLLSGIIQTTTNSRIIDGQSNAYGVFKDLSFTSTVSQDLGHPLADFNFDSSQGADLAPQFLDFFNVNWQGNSVTSTGFRLAAAGATAQGSNVNFYNNFATSFTEAAYMIGSGSACVPTNIATNAIAISWFGSDIQNSPAFGIENHGGTQLHYLDGTMENGGFIGLGQAAQTGGDFCANNMNAGGGPFVVENYRSESAKMISSVGGAGANFSLINAVTLDQVAVPLPGGTGSVGQLIQGDPACNHGLYEKISVGGTFSGLGTSGSPLHAASGTSTSITDNTGGFTVNAWTGWDVCIVSGTGSTPAQYCVVTSNTASTFTCAAGWQSDYSAANGITTLPNPDATTLYKIEPNWGTQTTDGGVTFGIDNTTYLGVLAVNGAFLPGKRITVGNDVGNFNNLQVTRSDWATTGAFMDQPAVPFLANVIAGSPVTAGGGVAGINLGTSLFVRSYGLPRNSLTELALPFKQELGTRALHWFSGVSTGGLSAADVYIGSDPNAGSAGQGDLFIENNSANIGRKWTFNFDGSSSFPASITSAGTAATLAGTGACATRSGQLGGSFAGQITCTGTTGASTLTITPGNTAPNGFTCWANDITHTLAGSQSTASTTAPVMSFTTVTASDVVTFGCIAY